ncbi:MAG: amylo-alpha-1,6-glucosidase [Acidimicrobiia bacterium]
MAATNYAELMQRARAVLDGNWMGHATRPGPHLYPHQWSWDAGFIAIGYAHYDQERAQQELRSLFEAQWANGLLPHIVFNPDAGEYFPGPDFWQVNRSPHAPAEPATSGIVQPPNHATAAWHIYRYAREPVRARAFLEGLFPKLVAWHEYLYRERDPDGEGLVYIRHPWESGQDNSPIWDRTLRRINPAPDEIPSYRRADLGIVAADDRPRDAAYDRYVYLIKLFRDRDYDQARIVKDSPFLIQDVLFNTLLVQANRDLAEIARLLGKGPGRFEEWAEQTAAAINAKLWEADHGIYFDFDLRSGERIHAHVAAGFTPLFAGVPDLEQAQLIVDKLNSKGFCPLNEDCWPVPSYDKEEPGFDPKRYWRGPIWMNVDWLLYRGLRRYGFDAYADKVRQAIIELPTQCGFYEYFDPDTMEGHGTDQFSWTAALLIDLLAEEGVEP